MQPSQSPISSTPTAADIDQMAIQFLELEKNVDDAYAIAVAADERPERMRESLADLVEEFGSSHAEKSKLLHGVEYEIITTFGVTLLRAGAPHFLYVTEVWTAFTGCYMYAIWYSRCGALFCVSNR